jgi:hypothetical protein
MRRIKHAVVILFTVLVTAGVAWPQQDVPESESAPDVPDAIALPEGFKPVLFVHASGSQIYACQADAQGKYS